MSRTQPDPDSILGLINEIGRLLTEMDGQPRPPITVERVTLHEQDELCVCCGARSIRMTRDPAQPGVRSVVCSKCSTADRPSDYPPTGWV